jgi:hypothetical protein
VETRRREVVLVVEEREEKVAIDGGYKTIWVFSLLFGRKRGEGESARGSRGGKGKGGTGRCWQWAGSFEKSESPILDWLVQCQSERVD